MNMRALTKRCSSQARPAAFSRNRAKCVSVRANANNGVATKDIIDSIDEAKLKELERRFKVCIGKRNVQQSGAVCCYL